MCQPLGIDWSVLRALNDFLYRHDGVEDPLLFYVNVSEALFIATLALVFLAASGARHAAVALALWSPPLRGRVDALSDWLGGYWDRALGWGAGLVGIGWRPR